MRTFFYESIKYFVDEKGGKITDFVLVLDFMRKLKELNVSLGNEETYALLQRIKSEYSDEEVLLDKLVYLLTKQGHKEEYKSEEGYFLTKLTAFLAEAKLSILEWKAKELSESEEISLSKLNEYLTNVAVLNSDCPSIPLTDCIKAKKVNVAKLIERISLFLIKTQQFDKEELPKVRSRISENLEEVAESECAEQGEKCQENEEKSDDNLGIKTVDAVKEESERYSDDFEERGSKGKRTVKHVERLSNSSATFEIRKEQRAKTELVRSKVIGKYDKNLDDEAFINKATPNKNYTIVNFSMPKEKDIDLGEEKEQVYKRERSLIFQNGSIEKVVE